MPYVVTFSSLFVVHCAFRLYIIHPFNISDLA